MPGTATGLLSSHRWTLRATDSAGVSKILPGVRGDPAIGEVNPSGRSSEAVRERGLIVGYMDGDEAEINVTWSAVDSPEVQDFCDFCQGVGATYGDGGTAPMVSVNPVGETKAVFLDAIKAPASGAPRTHHFTLAVLSYTPKGGVPESTKDLSFKCAGHTES